MHSSGGFLKENESENLQVSNSREGDPVHSCLVGLYCWMIFQT